MTGLNQSLKKVSIPLSGAFLLWAFLVNAGLLIGFLFQSP